MRTVCASALGRRGPWLLVAVLVAVSPRHVSAQAGHPDQDSTSITGLLARRPTVFPRVVAEPFDRRAAWMPAAGVSAVEPMRPMDPLGRTLRPLDGLPFPGDDGSRLSPLIGAAVGAAAGFGIAAYKCSRA